MACSPPGAARCGEGTHAARRRQELPWVRVDKEYHFDTDKGNASLADLFGGRSQLLVYHFMFGPDYTAGCPSCSAIADGFDGFVVHLANHDVTLSAVSRAPLAKLLPYKQRMGWTFPWASSRGSAFNFDFNVSFTEEQQRRGAGYNFRRDDPVMEAGIGGKQIGVTSANSIVTGTDVDCPPPPEMLSDVVPGERASMAYCVRDCFLICTPLPVAVKSPE